MLCRPCHIIPLMPTPHHTASHHASPHHTLPQEDDTPRGHGASCVVNDVIVRQVMHLQWMVDDAVVVPRKQGRVTESDNRAAEWVAFLFTFGQLVDQFS